MNLLFNSSNPKFPWKWLKESKNGGVCINTSTGNKGKARNFKEFLQAMLVLLDWGER